MKQSGSMKILLGLQSDVVAESAAGLREALVEKREEIRGGSVRSGRGADEGLLAVWIGDARDGGRIGIGKIDS